MDGAEAASVSGMSISSLFPTFGGICKCRASSNSSSRAKSSAGQHCRIFKRVASRSVCKLHGWLPDRDQAGMDACLDLFAQLYVPMNSPEILNAAHEYVAKGIPVIPTSGKVAAVAWKDFQTRLPTMAE